MAVDTRIRWKGIGAGDKKKPGACKHSRMKEWSADHMLAMGILNCPDCGLVCTAEGKREHWMFADPEDLDPRPARHKPE